MYFPFIGLSQHLQQSVSEISYLLIIVIFPNSLIIILFLYNLNSDERIVSCALMLTGSFYFTYFVGSLSHLIVDKDSR